MHLNTPIDQRMMSGRRCTSRIPRGDDMRRAVEPFYCMYEGDWQPAPASHTKEWWWECLTIRKMENMELLCMQRSEPDKAPSAIDGLTVEQEAADGSAHESSAGGDTDSDHGNAARPPDVEDPSESDVEQKGAGA